MNNKYTYKFITSAKRISKNVGFSEANIWVTYAKNPKKANHLRCLDIGTFIMENNISDSDIILAVNTIIATKREVRNKI